MIRTVSVFAATMIAVTAAQAGSIQIGGPTGLTSSYITGNGGSVGSQFSIGSYNGVLFSGVSVTGSPTISNSPSNTTVSDTTNGVDFALVNDGIAADNVWAASSGTPTGSSNSLTIPVNVYGVSSVWTMINLINGTSGAREANIIFNFASTAGATTGLTSYQTKLTSAGSTSGAAAAGQLHDAVICVSGGCPTDNNGPVLSSSVPSTTKLPSTADNEITVLTNNLQSYGYTATTGIYSGTAGSVVLDDQGFLFSGSILTTAQSNYLVSVTVMSPDSVTGHGFGLSAVSVQTPEPTTVFMVLTGLGFVGFGRLRRKA